MINIIFHEYCNQTGKHNLLKALLCFLFLNKFRIVCYVRRIQKTNSSLLKIFYINQLEKKYCIKIGENAIIGDNISIHHHFGIVIGNNTIIGDNCNIYHQVTLGHKNNKYPVVGNNVTLYPGCKIIGDVHIGDNAIVAPNSVVIDDVPNGAIVSGVPARIIKL